MLVPMARPSRMPVMELLPLVSKLPLLLLFPFFSPFRLRIGDIMARTCVVESRLLPPPAPADPPPDYEKPQN